MTVTNQTQKVTATGNASATTYSFSPIVIYAASELVVVTTVIATGAETTRTQGTGATNWSTTITDFPATGSIVYPADTVTPLPATETITVKRVLTLEQQTDLENQGGYFADTQETQFDKLVMIDLQQQEELDRAMTYPVSYTGGASAELPVPVANGYLLYNAAADAITTTTSSAAQYLGGDGTVSLPFYSFSADPDSGLYRIGANNIGLSVNGAKGFDLDTSGFNGALGQTTAAAGSFTTLTASGTTTFTGITTHGGNVVSDANSTDDLGTTGVRWANLFVDAITITDNQTIGGNLTVTGNLTINGTTVTNDATNTTIKDPLIGLNEGAASNTNDLGLIMERGSTGDNGFMGWDESGDYFAVGTTTATGSSTGNVSYTFADFYCAGIVSTSGTLAGLTSFGMSAGATITAGVLDEDDMVSDSAVAMATQQSIKAYVDANAQAPGIQMAWETTTTDTDQGNGKVWLNNATPSAATVLYLDDLEAGGVSINAWADTLDDSSNASSRGMIVIAKEGAGNNRHVFNVTGAVTSASTYSKVAVTHVISVGTISDADEVGVFFARSGADGAGDLLAANNLSDVASAATSFGNIKQSATTSAMGVVEKSTSAENVTGASDTVYPSVAGTKEMIDTHAGASMSASHISGLLTSSDTDTAHDINITAGECRDAADGVDMTLATEITKQIDAAWALGDDAGGLDTGTVAATTLYAFWLIQRSDTSVEDALFSLSFTAPTMPTNYDKKRLIGAVTTDASANILAFTQKGDVFFYDTGPTDINDGTITNNTLETGTLSVPPWSLAYVNGTATNATSAQPYTALYIGQTGTTTVDVHSKFIDINIGSGSFDRLHGRGMVMVDGSSQFKYAMNEPDGAGSVTIATIGFLMASRSQP